MKFPLGIVCSISLMGFCYALISATKKLTRDYYRLNKSDKLGEVGTLDCFYFICLHVWKSQSSNRLILKRWTCYSFLTLLIPLSEKKELCIQCLNYYTTWTYSHMKLIPWSVTVLLKFYRYVCFFFLTWYVSVLMTLFIVIVVYSHIKTVGHIY